MRCLTLADALHSGGAEVLFVSRYLSEHLRGALTVRGYGLQQLDTTSVASQGEKDLPHSYWLGVSQPADAQDTIRTLSNFEVDWLVMDHYALDSKWESALRTTVKKILVIDDIADRHHDCDILLDQNLFTDMETRYIGKISDRCRLMLGPKFALLRNEFSHLREFTSTRNGIVRRILVSMGGVDAKNLTATSVNAIAQLRNPAIAVDVVIGKTHPALEEIQRTCQLYGYQCHIEASNMAELMAAADLAIGSSGATSWERCCLGLPTICLTQADNQVAIAEGLEAHGAIVNLGEGHIVDTAALSAIIAGLVAQPKALMNMSEASIKLVDGKGANRVCQNMLGMI